MPTKKLRKPASTADKPVKALAKKPKPRIEKDEHGTLSDDAQSVGIKFTDWIVPNTFVRVDAKKQLVTNNPICTVMPDGLHVSWGNCGRCCMRVTICECNGGVLHPPSIEWFYVHALLNEAGIDVTTTGGLIDSRDHRILSRGIYWYAHKRPGSGGMWLPSTVSRPAKPLTKGTTFPSNGRKPLSKGKTLRKPSQAGRTAHKAAQTNAEPVEVDFGKLDKAAEQDRKSQIEAAMQRLEKSSGEKPKRLAKPKRLRKGK